MINMPNKYLENGVGEVEERGVRKLIKGSDI